MSGMKYVDMSYDFLLQYDDKEKLWKAETIGPLNVVETGQTYQEAYDGLIGTLNLLHAIILRDAKVTYDDYVKNSNRPSSQEANKKWADAWHWEPRALRAPEKNKCFRGTFENYEWGKGVRIAKDEKEGTAE